MFNKDKFSGITLNPEESKVLLLLGNQKDKYMIMSEKITIHDQNYVVSYDVSDAKAKMNVKRMRFTGKSDHTTTCKSKH